MPAPASPPDFRAAAERHLLDGEYLERAGRTVNADHLAGLAAECALKATLADFLGATPNRRGFLASTPGQGGSITHDVHVSTLWDQVIRIARGRAGAAFVSTLTSSRPFDTWNIADRYADGSSLTPTMTRARLATARSLLGHHQRARILGVLA